MTDLSWRDFFNSLIKFFNRLENFQCYKERYIIYYEYDHVFNGNSNLKEHMQIYTRELQLKSGKFTKALNGEVLCRILF